MLLITLILIPLTGIFLILTTANKDVSYSGEFNNISVEKENLYKLNLNQKRIKIIGLATSIANL